ncbi:hypothetical protein AWB80_08322 [Caballeronia pedi]|uniref:Uncharacterized protein n=1 Tax=Caballeronia pedi TaxID=1777141 RepID=A0A158E6B9_9BURK|nr:hypothetical protein [Caballeronia pedi]SAL02270.1 hypothetical protein AWB80_08322 [Caballeronia pedi]
MPVTINDVLSTPDGSLEFHFTVSDGRHNDALIATLTLNEAVAIAKGKNAGDVFAMCCAIIETREYQSLIGRTFGDTG